MVLIPTKKSINDYYFEGIHVLKLPSNDVPKILRKYDPDIVALHGLLPIQHFIRVLPRIISICKEEKIPIISWIHGSEALFSASHFYFSPMGIRTNFEKFLTVLYDPVQRMFLWMILKHSTSVIFASKWMQNMCERYIGFKHPNSFVLPNPVDTCIFKPIVDNIKYRMREGVSIRSLNWKYGLDIAIKSFSRLDAQLTILGCGPLEKYLRKYTNYYESNVVLQTEPIPHNEMPFFYNKYGFFVAPSRTEGQGVAMCEAMACGLPVIATKVGGIPEFVLHGVNGLLVPPEDYLSLRKAVRNLTSDEELFTSLSNNAVDYCRKKLSFNAVFTKEYEVLKDSLSLSNRAEKKYVFPVI